MLAVALALVVLGLVLLFIIPWIGVPLGIVGLVLVAFYLVGVARRTSRTAEDGRIR